MWLTIFIALVALIFFYLKWHYAYFYRHKVPGPEPTMLVGNLGETLMMKRHHGEILDEWYKKYSEFPYIGYYKCLIPSLFIRDPEIISEILIKEFTSFAENDFEINEKVDPLLKHNPFFKVGDAWKRSRGLLSPLFSPNKIKVVYPLMEDTCEKLKKYIREKGTDFDFDSKDLSAKFTTDNVANVAFSVDGESFTNPKSEFRQMGKKIFQPSTLSAIHMLFILFFPLMKNVLPIPFLPKTVDVWIRNLINSNIKSRKGVKMGHEDLMQMLIQLSETKNLEAEEMTGHALSLFIEGYETSSTLLSFALYDLALNQDVQTQLREEITDVLTTHKEEFSYEALQEMKYLEMIVQETLRLHPVAMFMLKKCTKPFQLPPLPGQSIGFTVPIGMPVTISVYSMTRDPEYFPDPTRFDPYRHTEEEIKSRPKCAFLPFGEGPRMCMGMRFAITQTKVAIVTMIKNFHITESPNCKPFVIDPKAMLLQGIDPMLIRFEPITG